MDLFQEKYRIPSARLQAWDYSASGAYFITICTQNRAHFFGELYSGEMRLSEIGLLAEKFWNEIPDHFPFVELGNFVVMPNHVHGILIIESKSVETPNLGVSKTTGELGHLSGQYVQVPDATVQTQDVIVETSPAICETPRLGVSTVKTGGKKQEWKPGSIGVIVNQFKRMVTIHARKINPDFGWQARFHDHVIRNSNSFETIQHYIATNPENWPKDTFYN